MSQQRIKLFWRITGYNSLARIYEHTVPAGHLSDRGLEKLLQTLTAKAGLTEEEIIDSYVNRKTRRYRPLLEVRRDSGPVHMFTCGINPHFAATLVNAAGEPIRHPDPR